MYKLITDDYFDPEELLSSVDLSDEHNIVDLKNRVEASVVIWQKKMTHKDSKLSWGHGVSHEKRGKFEGRAENVLLLIKHRFPGIAQSALDISKIQCNRVQKSIHNSCCLLQIHYSAMFIRILCISPLLPCFFRMLVLPFWRVTPGLSRA